MTKELEELKQMIQNFNNQQRKSFQLNTVMPIEKIRKIEIEYHISFPEEYVAFITEIGDGGMIENNGEMIQIQSLRSYEEDGYTFEGVEKPFLLEHSWVEEFGDYIEENVELDEVVDKDEIEQNWTKRQNMIDNHGSILITPDLTNCQEEWVLIITGACKGEMWLRSDMGIQRGIHCNFTKWLHLYLTNGLYDFMMECGKRERVKNLEPVEECRALIKKNRIIMNPPILLSKVREFEERHNILLPKEYVIFLTEIGDGSKYRHSYSKKFNALLENNSLSDLDQPFIVQNESDYIHTFKDEKDYWRTFHKTTIWDFLFEKSILDSCQKNEPWLLPQYQLLKGCLPIMNGEGMKDNTKSKGIQYILILNGDYRGQVWMINKQKMSASICTVFTFLG